MSRVLFDQDVPRPLARLLTRHTVRTASQQGWATLANGDLLRAAADAGFEVLVTCDQNVRYQNRLDDVPVGLVVLMTTAWPDIRAAPDEAVAAVDAATPGSYRELTFPRRPRRSAPEAGDP